MRLRLMMLGLAACLVIALTLNIIVRSQDTANLQHKNLEISQNVEQSPTLTPSGSEDQGIIARLLGSIGPNSYPENVNPLTGLAVDDISVLERRPILVKISNAPPLVRPQSGIGEADIVFEHYAEGGLTRFSALFYGHAPTRVGSIRSARLIDHELVPMFDGMLAFSGASIGVEKYIYGSADVHARIEGSENTAPGGDIPPSEYAERAYKGVLYGLPYYWRDESIPVPHNMFTNLEALWQLAAQQGPGQRPNLKGLAFATQIPDDSDGPISEIDVRYRATRVLWQYDPQTNNYKRFADGIGHYDANTERQITADNVVIIYAVHTDTNIIESQWQGAISWSTQIAVWGEGDAILFRDGQHYVARWVRPIREEIISLRTTDGEMLYLKPGNTWFQIMPTPDQQNSAEEWLRMG